MKKIALFGFMGVLLLAGCISLEVTQKVSPDGSSVVIQKIDITKYVELASQSPGGTQDIDDMKSQFAQNCEEAKNEGKVLDCSIEDNIITISVETTPEKGGYEFEKTGGIIYNEYILRADQLPDVSEALPKNGSLAGASNSTIKFTGEDAKNAAQGLSLFGISITYIIEMPGEIVEAKNGEIKDGKAVYDVVELMQEGKTVEVRSKELNLVTVGGAVAIVTVVLFLVVFRRK